MRRRSRSGDGTTGNTSAAPNLFVVGAMRAGTTTLHRELARHPEIFMSAVKEPMHFALAEDSPRYAGPCDPGNDRHWVRAERYATLFRGRKDAVWAGESSTLYLYSPEAPERIRRASPGARIIMVLRDPAVRAYSHYCFARQRGLEPEPSFEGALAAEAGRVEKNWSSFWQYRGRSRYADGVERYLATFPAEQVFVGLFHDLVHDAATFYGRLEAFLGLHGSLGFDPPEPENPSRGVRSFAAARWERRLRRLVPPRVRARAWGSRPGRLLRSVVRPLRGLNREAIPPLHPGTERALRRELAPDIERLETLLDLDLSRWACRG